MTEVIEVGAGATGVPSHSVTMAARATGLTKIYGAGNTRVTALDGNEV